MPRPPPPARALMSTGQPMRRASLSAWSAEVSRSQPSARGTPASRAAMRAMSLLPMRSMTSGVGPMNTMPLSRHMRPNSAVSAKKPLPGWMAVAPDSTATVRMASLLR